MVVVAKRREKHLSTGVDIQFLLNILNSFMDLLCL